MYYYIFIYNIHLKKEKRLLYCYSCIIPLINITAYYSRLHPTNRIPFQPFFYARYRQLISIDIWYIICCRYIRKISVRAQRNAYDGGEAGVLRKRRPTPPESPARSTMVRSPAGENSYYFIIIILYNSIIYLPSFLITINYYCVHAAFNFDLFVGGGFIACEHRW